MNHLINLHFFCLSLSPNARSIAAVLFLHKRYYKLNCHPNLSKDR